MKEPGTILHYAHKPFNFPNFSPKLSIKEEIFRLFFTCLMFFLYKLRTKNMFAIKAPSNLFEILFQNGD